MNTRTNDKVLSRPNPQKLSCGCGLMAIKSGPAKAVPAVPAAPPLRLKKIIMIIIIIMNKSQELTVFHGRQKLTSAKN